MSRRILQICPHDLSPFSELCTRYAAAAQSLGLDMTTVFLSATDGPTMAGADYLDCADLADTNAVRRALSPYAGQSWDLVLCHRYRAYWAVVRSPLVKNPCVVLAHEFGLMARWQRRLNRRVFARDVRFAGVSPSVAADLSSAIGEAMVLPNVLDTAGHTLLSRAEALAVMGLEPGPLTIGVVGRLHYKKRPGLAVQAFQAFAADHPQARLVFIGDGEGRARLEAQRTPNVHVLGSIPDAPQLFAGFDVMLHTVRREPFGMVVLEALFAGVPVVTLRQAGPQHILGDLGVYAEADTGHGFAAAMERSLEVDRDAYTAAGRARIEEYFSIAALARALDHLLKP